MRASKGFTLIELLVVFAILGLVMTLVPIAYERMRDSAVYRDTVRTVLSDLRTARHRAISESREIRFDVDLEQRTYGLQGQAPRVLPQSVRLRSTVAALDRGDKRVASIRFLPTGGATGGTIEVVRPSGAGTRLTVDWLSGAVVQTAVSE